MGPQCEGLVDASREIPASMASWRLWGKRTACYHGLGRAKGAVKARRRTMNRLTVIGCVVLLVGAGCATTPKEGAKTLGDAASPAWSLDAAHEGMKVAVSPAGKTLRIAGSYGTVIGAGVDAVANARYREALHDALDDYDAAGIFEARLKARLEEASSNMTQVAPLGTAAGLRSLHEAAELRYESLAESGRDMVLDLTMTYGIFGPQGVLVAKLDGKLADVPRGRRLWHGTVLASTNAILASDRLADPTNRISPNWSSPRLKADEEAIAQWTGDGGGTIRRRFETAVNGVVSALLCELGLAEEAEGEYYLGKLAMNKKDFEGALTHFRKAVALAPDSLDAENGLAVTLGHMKKVDEAIATARAVADRAPDYGPAWYNLAWWYATEKADTATAKTCYEKAQALGIAPEERLEKALQGKK